MISQQKYCKDFVRVVSIFQNYESQTFIFKITNYCQTAVGKMDDKDWNSTLNKTSWLLQKTMWLNICPSYNYLGPSIMQHLGVFV